jgi:hypothetical protein
MNAWYIFGGFAALVFALWVLSVELRLRAAAMMGEMVVDDLHERGKVIVVERVKYSAERPSPARKSEGAR